MFSFCNTQLKRLIHRIFTIKAGGTVCNFLCVASTFRYAALYCKLILLSYYSNLLYTASLLPRSKTRWICEVGRGFVGTCSLRGFQFKPLNPLNHIKNIFSFSFFSFFIAGRALKTHPPVQFNTDQTPVGLLWTYC